MKMVLVPVSVPPPYPAVPYVLPGASQHQRITSIAAYANNWLKKPSIFQMIRRDVIRSDSRAWHGAVALVPTKLAQDVLAEPHSHPNSRIQFYPYPSTRKEPILRFVVIGRQRQDCRYRSLATSKTSSLLATVAVPPLPVAPSAGQSLVKRPLLSTFPTVTYLWKRWIVR